MPDQKSAPEQGAHMAAARREALLSQISEMSRRAGQSDAPTTIAVSKTFAADRIRPVLETGHIDFGENRVQEAADKWQALKEDFPHVRLHLIGPLQSNKTGQAMALFDAIHSLDRPKLARAIAAERDRTGHCPALFIQVNLGDEPQKAGVTTAELPALLALSRDTLGLPVVGLMCLPPATAVPAPYFAKLNNLATAHDVAHLSMGMSGDYKQAIEQGATHIRLGTAFFGQRS